MRRVEVLLLRAIRGGRASMGYRPGKNGYENWVAFSKTEVPEEVLWALCKAGHKITRQMTMHLNYGSAGSEAAFRLSMKGEDDAEDEQEAEGDHLPAANDAPAARPSGAQGP